MRHSIRIMLAASATVAALGIGCARIPDNDAPGGVLSGNEFQRSNATRGTTLDNSVVGTGRGSSIDASHSTAGPGAAGGTTASGTTGSRMTSGSGAAVVGPSAVAAPGAAGTAGGTTVVAPAPVGAGTTGI